MDLVATYTPDRMESAAPLGISNDLERGRIVHFPECPIPLPGEEDLDFLREKVPNHLKKKNVSYHARVRGVYGVRGRAVKKRACRILEAHFKEVWKFLKNTIPSLTTDWQPASASFRPIEEKDREIRRHESSELVHVDAGAYGASHGDRILRFFINANPTEERVWITKGSFAEVYRRYGREAGIVPDSRPPDFLAEGWTDRLYTGLLHSVSLLGLRSVVMADSSPYDRVMRKFHNWMKNTPEFQETPEGHQQVSFKPLSAWMVFTDGISHACISGRHAFIDTFIVPLRNCRMPEKAPYHILRNGQ